ncbi:hypothetical protein ACFQ1R_06170 [Mariniflexile jejuense]|uniref:Lipocalin-like domain-containing protein n=1 Tax=Mariniflexile jejuense TaxID=1173582 RepID=A0ABW3JHA2_9FLAO
MKTKLQTLLLLSFFALLLFTSCQDEVIEITQPTESEALVATSELTSMMSATSVMDGSADNIIDKASCLSVQLPVTVKVNGQEIIIASKEDYKTIEAIFNEFEDDDDVLNIVFPITVILSDHTEVTVQNKEALAVLVKECKGEDEDDDDIECIDFQYPISFSVFNAQFQIVNVVKIESDSQLHKFIKRVKNAEVIASINFPLNLVLADGTVITVNSNAELAATIKQAKDSCDEDDDNDYHDDDFTKERLDTLLKICPWVVNEFQRNTISLSNAYREYVITFKDDNIVKVRTRNGDMLTGTWSSRITKNGALIKLEFDTLVDFTLEWFVYEIEYGKIKLFTSNGNKLILKKNCDVVIDITKDRIENYLQECFWRIERLSVDGINNEKDYIGTPLKFFANNVVKLRVNGEYVSGTYEIGVRNIGFILQITLDGRPNLKLEWLITFLEPGLIKLENANNKMVLQRHCLDVDDDLKYIDAVIINGDWKVAKYDDGLVHVQDPTINFAGYTVNFLITGRIKVTDPNNGVTAGSWLAYRNDGLFLGLHFANQAPFNELSYRWRIKSITPNRIELKDLSSTGTVERILVLEKKS